VDVNTWAARAIDRSSDVKDWELLGYGNGTAGALTGEPTDNALVHFDPKGYGVNAFNFYADSPHQEIKDGSAHFTELMDKQSGEFDKEARAEILTELQTWILDNHWCNFAMPTAKSAYYGWSARMRDYAPDDWTNNYGIRRHSIWLA
jgi:hypothetical protein